MCEEKVWRKELGLHTNPLTQTFNQKSQMRMKILRMSAKVKRTHLRANFSNISYVPLLPLKEEKND